MGRRKKKAAKVNQYLANNSTEQEVEKIVIEDPAENVLEEVEVIEETVTTAAEADIEDVLEEVEEQIVKVAKNKKKRKKAKSED